MMKVIITSAPVYHRLDVLSMHVMPPTAVYLLAAIVRNEGFCIDVVDPEEIKDLFIDDQLSERQKSSLVNFYGSADIICVSSNTLTWPNAKVLIHFLKQFFPDKIIIAGGLHPSYFHEYIMNSTPVDYVIRGHAESILVELLHAIKNKGDVSTINNLCYRNNDKVKINKTSLICTKEMIQGNPLPAYDLVPSKLYHILPVESSRGCMFNCMFCSIPGHRNWVSCDIDWICKRITESIERFGKRFTSKTLYFTDDCFTADAYRASAILNYLSTRHPEYKIILETRATDILSENGDKLVAAFKNANIVRLATGVECGYDKGLAHIRKGLNIDLLTQSINKLCDNHLIERAFYTFIIGFPWESIDDCLHTVDFAAQLQVRYSRNIANLGWLFLLPSEIWETRNKYGICLDESVFDNKNYLIDDVFFEIIDPSIKVSGKQFVEERIKFYNDRGVMMRNP